jgi:Carboxypeptidase regulatory-like domain
MAMDFKSGLTLAVIVVLGWGSFACGQTARSETAPDSRAPGSVSGTIVDESGAVVAGARVTLSVEGQAQTLETRSGIDGQFFFPRVAPGPFQLAISVTGFGSKTYAGTVKTAEVETVPQIVLNIADAITEVQVGVSQVEVAQEQVKFEETQRVLGAIPNFYVSYVPDAAPLSVRQKFHLAWKTSVDPFTFAVVGGIAGVQQAQNHFVAYGQGAQGYGKRYGANYGDVVAGTFVGSAILPSLLKQDPRYFYKGTGSKTSRFFYAIANSVICKGDNKRWQVNYSNILGNMAAGAISNIYYPAQDRDDAALTFENAGIGIGATAIGNLFEEFLVKKLTPKLLHHDNSKP